MMYKNKTGSITKEIASEELDEYYKCGYRLDGLKLILEKVIELKNEALTDKTYQDILDTQAEYSKIFNLIVNKYFKKEFNNHENWFTRADFVNHTMTFSWYK